MKWKDTKLHLPTTDIPVLLIASSGESRANVASYSKARNRFEAISPFYMGGCIHAVEYWMELPVPPKISYELLIKKWEA